MKYNALGNTGLFVSEMCLGTMTFGQADGQYAAATGVNQQDAEAILRSAFDSGINFVDTANVYAGGQSEEILGRAISSLGIARHNLVIASKANHATGKGPNDSGSSRNHLIKEVEQILRRLDTDYIDLFQLHGWDPLTPLEETIRALDDMVRQGWIRYVGVSNWAAWQLEKALGVSRLHDYTTIQSFQGYYSLAGRDMERELIPMLLTERLGLMIYSPLAGGYLSGKYMDENSQGRRKSIAFPPVDEIKGLAVLTVIKDIAENREASMAAISLSWLLNQRVTTCIILGVKNLRQLDENLKATEVVLTPEEMDLLDQASKLTIEYPAWLYAYGESSRQRLAETGKLT